MAQRAVKSKLAAPDTEPMADAASPAAALDRFVGDPQFMQSLARGLLALGAVAKGRGQPVTAREISALTGLSVATARRCLYTLDATGYVRANRLGAVPGAALASLAADYTASSPIITHCGPILDDLRAELGESVSLAMFEGDQATIVASASSESLLKLDLPIGAVLPLHATAAGKILLAHLSEEALDRRLRLAELKAHTERTITSPVKLREELAHVSRRGFAVSDQELAIGIRTVGAPVHDARGAVIGSIGATTLVSTVGLRDLRARVVPALMRAAARLSALSA
jgi:IclR family pca regulon transcriptional regulator